MYWVIQDDIFREEGMGKLLAALERLGIPHSVHRAIAGALEPEVAPPPGPVMVIGAYSMNRIARARAWVPGAFVNENFDFAVQLTRWGAHMLNADALVCRLADVPVQRGPFFVRPTFDSKTFTGKVTSWPEFREWRQSILGGEAKPRGSLASVDTEVMVCRPKEIHREVRTWIVDREVVTASLYREGGRVRYAELVWDDPLVGFALARAAEWCPDQAFVLDVCETDDGPRIVEVNNINAAGFYAADVAKIVMAIESLDY